MRTTCTDLQWYPASNIALLSYCAILHNWHKSIYIAHFCQRTWKFAVPWYQDSLDHCSMLINADKNPGVDPKYLCWSALGSMPQWCSPQFVQVLDARAKASPRKTPFWLALGNDPGSPVIYMLMQPLITHFRGSPIRINFLLDKTVLLGAIRVLMACILVAFL